MQAVSQEHYLYEIDLIAWWINEGAKYDAKVKEVTKEEDIVSILKKYETPEGLEGLGIEPIEESKLTSIKKKGILINRVSAESPFVEVDLSNRKTVDKRTLKTLNAVSDHLISLDISSTDVQDSDLTVLSDFPHLRKLYLQKTNVTDQVIEYIKDLEYLEYLNLYETNITDDAFTYLKELEQLKSLYLWQTDVSSKGIAQHLNDRPNLIINNGIDPSLFGYSQLKPPTLVSEAKIIVDSIKVELEMNLKATKIYYTLDGSNPDSTSTLYDEPIWLSKSSTIKAMAQKEGWKTSEVTSQSFSVSKYIPDLITLKSQPHEKYAASGATSLKDLRKGSTKFRDGDWLGFEKDHVVATLDLGKEVPISSVTVGALEATGSYIFYPKGIEVAISDNGTSFKKVAGTSYDAPKASRSPETSEFKELFPTETTRYVRVRIESNLVNPDWHIDPGAPCWVFIDEILIE